MGDKLANKSLLDYKYGTAFMHRSRIRRNDAESFAVSFSLNHPHWVDSFIESPCPSVCLCVCTIRCPPPEKKLGKDKKICRSPKFFSSLFGNGDTIHMGREIQCFLYAGFFCFEMGVNWKYTLHTHPK